MDEIEPRKPGRKPSHPPTPEEVAAVVTAYNERRNEAVAVIAKDIGMSGKRFYECLRVARGK
jgi:hypothetical protein